MSFDLHLLFIIKVKTVTLMRVSVLSWWQIGVCSTFEVCTSSQLRWDDISHLTMVNVYWGEIYSPQKVNRHLNVLFWGVTCESSLWIWLRNERKWGWGISVLSGDPWWCNMQAGTWMVDQISFMLMMTVCARPWEFFSWTGWYSTQLSNIDDSHCKLSGTEAAQPLFP